MEVIFVDPEPPDPSGGGIRTYLRLALQACRLRGIAARVYTHTPAAFAGERAFPIGRKPWLPPPWRGLAYRLCYGENVLFEQARWLGDELARSDGPDCVYEFADYHGYAWFALRNRRLRGRISLRVHTPNFLIDPPDRSWKSRLAAWIGRRREQWCLRRAAHLTVPSAAFVREKLPWLHGWEHLPNPLPDSPRALPSPPPPRRRILCLGRVEPRKGSLVLLRAFLRIAASLPDATLTFVGAETPGRYCGDLKALIASQPAALRARIAWEPPCRPEGRDALFARFDILVAPSLWENSPYVYFEGMAAGLLCVGSATGEMRETALQTGGILAAPGDEAALAAALQEACTAINRARLLAAQKAYLDERRLAAPEKLAAHWRGILGGAGAA